jgi:transcriptional regulator with XRE-family HTH domain
MTRTSTGNSSILVTASAGDRLRAARQAADLTQEQLAFVSTLSARTVYNAEHGQLPHRSTRLLIASALGVAVEEIWP